MIRDSSRAAMQFWPPVSSAFCATLRLDLVGQSINLLLQRTAYCGGLRKRIFGGSIHGDFWHFSLS